MTAHTCHAPGCTRSVPPRLFACAAHWRLVPTWLQTCLYDVYRPGQERTKVVTPAYLLVQTRCRIAVAAAEHKPVADLVAELRAIVAKCSPNGPLHELIRDRSDAEVLEVLDAGLPDFTRRRAAAWGAR